MTTSLALYCDAPTWAQCHFVRDLRAQADRWGWSSMVISGCLPYVAGGMFYSPCQGAADNAASLGAARASTGLWSHCSYGGWFTDDPLTERLPAVPYHVTNAYQYHLLGERAPYLPSGVNTDLFRPPAEGPDSRRERHKRDPRIVIGWTGSLQYNAALKLFLDRWIPAVRRAGTDGPLAQAKFCARPLAVWDCADARCPTQVAEYLQGIDVYLCTSVSEGCSLSVLEAAAAGCVIVSTPVGNAPELVLDDRLLIDWSPESAARVLTLLHRDREWLYAIGDRTREIVEKHWAWDVRAPLWKAWLSGDGEIPPPEVQMPYAAGLDAGILRRTRAYRERSTPPLARGDMYAS